MLQKQNGRGKSVKVTFSLPADVQSERACLLGDFNNWDENAAPMQRDDENGFSITLNLKKGQEYQFRYLVNDGEWYNDSQADGYVLNPFGSDNSVVTT